MYGPSELKRTAATVRLPLLGAAAALVLGGCQATGNDCQTISHFHPPRVALVGALVLPRCLAGYHIV